jgi:serine/threonine-protein kinase
LQRIIERALEKDPSKRYQTAVQMGADLKRAAVALGQSTIDGNALTETLALPVTRPVATPANRRWLAAGVGGVVLLAALGGSVYWWRGRTAAPVVVAPKAALARQVAVLPFEADDKTRSIADGFAEVLAGALANIERTSGAVAPIPPGDLRSRRVTTPEEARRVYGANLALTGNAHPTGDKVEFLVRLVDTQTLQQQGERKFLFDPKNPIRSRDLAVSELANLLSVAVPPTALTDTAAPSAYSAYLTGRGFLARHDQPKNVDRAIASFETATRQDPKFALAYAGLGEAYWRKAFSTNDQKWAVLANTNAERAVQLDPNLAVAHRVLGTVYLDAGRRDDAVRELHRAVELAPDNAEALQKLAEVYKTLGRFDDAEKLYVSSTKSHPTDWYGYLLLGVFYYERERYPDAEAAMNQAKALTPDNELVRVDLAGIYRMHGRYDEAAAEYQQALRLRSTPAAYAGLAGVYYYQHKFAEAVAAVEAAIELRSDEYRYWGNLGIYCRWAPGNESKSAPALRRAIELANKRAETTRSDYAVYANLAEYRARLGDAKGAMEEIGRIPTPARRPFATRMAIVYELTGRRDKALEVVRSYFKSPESRNQIKDDPDLAALWQAAFR